MLGFRDNGQALSAIVVIEIALLRSKWQCTRIFSQSRGASAACMQAVDRQERLAATMTQDVEGEFGNVNWLAEYSDGTR